VRERNRFAELPTTGKEIGEPILATFREESDTMGSIKVESDKLWGAETQRSLEYFSIGKDLIPRELIPAFAILKKAAANANYGIPPAWAVFFLGKDLP
jgi:hypothetical protein